MEIVGSLMYMATCTRPDISHAVNTLARFMAAPTTVHMEHAKHVLRYLRSSTAYGITSVTALDSSASASRMDQTGQPAHTPRWANLRGGGALLEHCGLL
eukprot:153360-Chlamydomonas_euryale.AAC.1